MRPYWRYEAIPLQPRTEAHCVHTGSGIACLTELRWAFQESESFVMDRCGSHDHSAAKAVASVAERNSKHEPQHPQTIKHTVLRMQGD